MTVYVKDDLAPEDNAMVQALYSRSRKQSIVDRLPIPPEKAGKFMEDYYIGYNHQSIGDCGSTTIFVEDVAMPVAKALQDWALYSGQESSTRYIDFGQVRFEDPLDCPKLQEMWRQLYIRSYEPVAVHVKKQHPRLEGEDPKDYRNAVKARTFDIVRSMLPAGATTNLSWHTNLRQAYDHLDGLLSHPDRFVRSTGQDIYRVLRQCYPNSFGEPRHGWWYGQVQAQHNYLRMRHLSPAVNSYKPRTKFTIARSLESYRDLLADRPRGALLPRVLEELGQIKSEFVLDYASFRDVQRHRNGVVRMPLLEWGPIHHWYLGQMPVEVHKDFDATLGEAKKVIEDLDTDPIMRQYYLPMGMLVPVRITQCLPGFVYRMELRTGKTTHSTLRATTQAEVRAIQQEFPWLVLHVDMQADSWDLRRGKQTITHKETENGDE